MTALIVVGKAAVYGVVVVPDSDTLAIMRRGSGGEWYGVASVNATDGSSALVGQPIPEVRDALEREWCIHVTRQHMEAVP